jgi:hypothetical protein
MRFGEAEQVWWTWYLIHRFDTAQHAEFRAVKQIGFRMFLPMRSLETTTGSRGIYFEAFELHSFN